MAESKYYGKYRANVVDLNDPEERGRIRVECPAVLGTSKSSWCEPCSPVAYDGGGDFCAPKKGDTVWVEFEEGDANKPIWTGNWWATKKHPLSSYAKVEEERVIEYKGVKLTFTENHLIIKIGSSVIDMTENEIKFDSSAITAKASKIDLN